MVFLNESPESADPRRHLSRELERMTCQYRSSIPTRCQAIARFYQQQDLATCMRLSHQLAGTSALYGLSGISRRAKQLEDALRSGQDGKVESILDGLLFEAD